MLYEKTQKMQDSESSESEEESKSNNGDADEYESEVEKANKKDVHREIVELKRELIGLLETDENANAAL